VAFRDDAEAARARADALEGAARAVLTRMSTAELERERGPLADLIRAEADEDFERLGLELQTLVLGTMERSS